jgi:hypothetical protein
MLRPSIQYSEHIHQAPVPTANSLVNKMHACLWISVSGQRHEMKMMIECVTA